MHKSFSGQIKVIHLKSYFYKHFRFTRYVRENEDTMFVFLLDVYH